MVTQKQMRMMPPRHWISLQVSETRTSYVLRSRGRRDAARKRAEVALTAAAILCLFGAYLLMLLPQILVGALVAVPGFLLPAIMVAVALGLYAFATRGHTPEVRFDKVRNEVWVCSRNSKGDARIQTRLSKSDIQSMYVQRPGDRTRDAAIFARIKGKARQVCLVRGRLDEIEAAHTDLCTVLASEQRREARNFTAAIRPRRVKGTVRVRVTA